MKSNILVALTAICLGTGAFAAQKVVTNKAIKAVPRSTTTSKRTTTIVERTTTIAQHTTPRASAIQTRISQPEEPKSSFRLNRMTVQAGSVFSPDIQVNKDDGSGSLAGATGGFTGGITMDFGGRAVVLETGFLYRQIGISGTRGDDTLIFSADYVSLPLLAKLYFNSDRRGSNSIFIKGGLEGSKLLSKSLVTEGPIAKEIDSQSLLNGVPEYELGAVVGLGGMISLNPTTDLLIEGNVYRGFNTVGTVLDTAYNNTNAAVIGGLSFKF